MNLPGPDPTIEFTTAYFELYRDLLHQQSGMVFDETKRIVLRNAIVDRMSTLQIADYRVYFELLLAAPETDNRPDFSLAANYPRNTPDVEILKLIEAVAINETSFFRNKEHYRTLQEEILPRLFRRHASDRHLRFWSAGCSTGQEPYSLAICVVDTLSKAGEIPEDWHIEILATDISGRVLNIASQGRYRSDEMRGLSAEQIERYFRPISDPTVMTAPLDPSQIYIPGKVTANRGRLQASFEVSPEIRKLVKFDFLNLIAPDFPLDLFQQLDLVLCENVTIYFSSDITRAVVENIFNALASGGFLFIGYSETLWQISDRFKLINSQETFYYQKPFPHEDLSRLVRHKALTGPFTPSPEVTAARQAFNKTLPPNRGGFPLKESTRQQIQLPQHAFQERTETSQKSKTAPSQDDSLAPQNVGLTQSGPATGQSAGKPSEKRDGRSLLVEGKGKMAAHEFDQALTFLELAMLVRPLDDEVLGVMAELKLKLGDYDTALKLCKQVIQINRLSEAGHLMLAMIYHKEGQIEAAIQEYRTTIFINLENVIAYLRLGDIFRDTRQPREALREYRRALDVLRKKAPDEIIEDLSVGLLRQACEQNIARLNQRGFR